MIKIQLKILRGHYSNYLHLKQIFVVDEEGYCMTPFNPCDTIYASKDGTIRADLERYVKDNWTDADFEKEYLERLERLKLNYAAKEWHDEDEFNPFEGEKTGEYPFNEEGRKEHINDARKAAKEAVRFGESFVKCLEEGANLTEEKAQELYVSLRKKLLQCCQFGFDNLVGDFWFKIGNEVVVEIDNCLCKKKAWKSETMAKAKAMLMA